MVQANDVYAHRFSLCAHSVNGCKVQLLESELQNSEQQEAIELIERAGKYLVALVDQVLDLVKLEGYIHEPQSEAVGLVALLEECQELVRANAFARGICIRIEPAESERLRISIGDTVCGIAEEHQANIFMLFQRLGAEQGTIEGNSLGLAISRVLACRMEWCAEFQQSRRQLLLAGTATGGAAVFL